MAKTVYNSETIELQDGTEVTLKPLPIGRLRRFMTAWREFVNIEEDDQAFDIYVNCAGIALEKELGDRVEKTRDAEKTITDEYREILEDVLDMDTIVRILEVCGGLNLSDPKVQAEAERIMAEAEAAGKN